MPAARSQSYSGLPTQQRRSAAEGMAASVSEKVPVAKRSAIGGVTASLSENVPNLRRSGAGGMAASLSEKVPATKRSAVEGMTASLSEKMSTTRGGASTGGAGAGRGVKPSLPSLPSLPSTPSSQPTCSSASSSTSSPSAPTSPSSPPSAPGSSRLLSRRSSPLAGAPRRREARASVPDAAPAAPSPSSSSSASAAGAADLAAGGSPASPLAGGAGGSSSRSGRPPTSEVAAALLPPVRFPTSPAAAPSSSHSSASVSALGLGFAPLQRGAGGAGELEGGEPRRQALAPQLPLAPLLPSVGGDAAAGSSLLASCAALRNLIGGGGGEAQQPQHRQRLLQIAQQRRRRRKPQSLEDGDFALLDGLVVGGIQAAPLFQYLRLRETAAVSAASCLIRSFSLGPSGRLLAPSVTYRRQWAERVDLPSVEVLFADDAGIVTHTHSTELSSCLSLCTSLRSLYCAKNTKLVAAEFAVALLELKELSVLDLSHSRLAIDDHRSFSREQPLGPLISALPPTLRILDLSYNLMKDEHAYMLAEALEASLGARPPVLEQLLLRSNCFGNGAGFALGALLQAHAGSELKRLDLRTNCVEAEGACAMLKAIQSHGSLRELRVGYNRQNKHQDLETAHVASVLLRKALSASSVSRLELLDLNNVRMGDSGARQLSLALAANEVLKRLDLTFNGIGPEGAGFLADALETNGRLEELDLRDNEIGDEGAEALAAGLQKNYALRRLQLARNGVDQRGAFALLGAVRERSDLSVDFGASGAGALNSLQLRSIMGRTTSMASLAILREAEREYRAPRETTDNSMSLMFAC